MQARRSCAFGGFVEVGFDFQLEPPHELQLHHRHGSKFKYSGRAQLQRATYR